MSFLPSWSLLRVVIILRVPWTARRSNQSILKEISPGYSLEGLMLKLKIQYFGHCMRRVDSLEKTLILGGIGDRRRRGRQKMRWLDSVTDSMGWVWINSGSWWWTRRPGVLWFMGVAKSQTRLSDLTELNWTVFDPLRVFDTNISYSYFRPWDPVYRKGDAAMDPWPTSYSITYHSEATDLMEQWRN